MRFAHFATPARILALTLLPATLPLHAADAPAQSTAARVPLGTRTLWVEPKGGSYRPITTGGKVEGDYSVSLDNSPQTLAIYASNEQPVPGATPLVRYSLSGLNARNSHVEVTLSLHHGLLEASAKDAKGTPVAIAPMGRAEIAKASLPETKAGTGAPAPISALKGRSLTASVGLRSGSGVFVPFLRSGAEPGQTATVVKSRRFPSQTTADITVYEGENPYVEKDHEVAHYLISGLSPDPKAHFELQFSVEPSGKVKLAQAIDTATRQPLTVHPYSDSEARRLKENFGEDGAPAPVAAKGN